jgi:ribose transport system permease protein
VPTTKTIGPEAGPGARETPIPGAGEESLQARIKQLAKNIPGPVIGLVVICIAMSLLSPYFLTPNNLINVLSQISYIGMMAVGAALVIILGGIDLSVGSTMALSFMATAFLYKEIGLPFWLAMI